MHHHRMAIHTKIHINHYLLQLRSSGKQGGIMDKPLVQYGNALVY